MEQEKSLRAAGLTGRCYVKEIDEIRLETFEKACFLAQENQEQPLLLWVVEGKVCSSIDGRACTLGPGDLMLYGPGQYYVQYIDDDREACALLIRFHGPGLLKPGLCGRKFAAVSGQAEFLEELKTLDQFGPELLLCLLTGLLLRLQRKEAGEEEPEDIRNPEQEIIRRAQAYVAEHVYDHLTVPIVADRTKVSASYLTALFRKNLHISPGDYIRRAKLQESRRLIRDNQMNFTEIARVLHYSTVHHFSRQFKDKFGISPTEYAQKVRETE